MKNQGKSKNTYFDSKKTRNLYGTYFLWLKKIGISSLLIYRRHVLKIPTQRNTEILREYDKVTV